MVEKVKMPCNPIYKGMQNFSPIRNREVDEPLFDKQRETK